MKELASALIIAGFYFLYLLPFLAWESCFVAGLKSTRDYVPGLIPLSNWSRYLELLQSGDGTTAIAILSGWVAVGILAIVGPVTLRVYRAAERERAKRLAAEAKRLAAERRAKAWDAARALFEQTERKLAVANGRLDIAERNFADNAFAPFWDSLENAVTGFADVNSGVQQIKSKILEFQECSRQCGQTAAELPVGTVALAKLDVSLPAERLRTILRKAQCNFHFALIYEQRKTRQALSKALDGMTSRIAESIEDLSASVARFETDLHGSMEDANSELSNMNSQFSQYSDASAARQEKVLKVLGNIERSM